VVEANETAEQIAQERAHHVFLGDGQRPVIPALSHQFHEGLHDFVDQFRHRQEGGKNT